MPLALTIARNLVVDQHRKHGRVELQPFPAQDRAVSDVEQRALARVHLGAVHRSLQRMNPRYRRLLLVEAGYVAGGSDAASPATRTARARAREGLNLLVERLPDAAWVFVAPVAGFGRRSSDRLRLLLGRGDWATMSQVVAGLGVFLAALPSPQLASPVGPGGSIPPPLSIGRGAPITSRVVADPSAPRLVESGGSSVEETARARDGHADPAAPPGGSPPSLVPPGFGSKGSGSGQGHTGLDGVDEVGEGSGTIAGQPVAWRYRIRYGHSECVAAALAGEPSLACEPTPRARAKGSVRHGDDEASFDTSDP